MVVAPGVLRSIGEHVAPFLQGGTVTVVTDDTVDALYGERVCTSLTKNGSSVHRFVIPHGESSKSAETLIRLLNFMAQHRMTRSDLVVALGGGVVGDLAGFAAAVYLRGIRYIQLPTTLLAMVDSSVGGKTAINLQMGKNLAGAFHQPVLVLCDTEALDSLPPEVFRDGMAEVMKYGFLQDAELLYTLLSDGANNPGEMVRRCIQIKSEIVSADERDMGQRQLLNFGHTIGHAIEACSDYTISHGNAVAIGMAMISQAAVPMFGCTKDVPELLRSLLQKFGLPFSTTFPAKRLYNAALSDKKNRSGTMTLVVPVRTGECRLEQIPAAALSDVIESGMTGGI